MNTNELLNSMADRLGSNSKASLVYGSPIQAGERVVLPVAKVSYAFAGGGGGTTKDQSAEGGGAGAVRAVPVGVVEILPTGTRFVSFSPWKTWAALIGIGAALGFFLSSKRRT